MSDCDSGNDLFQQSIVREFHASVFTANLTHQIIARNASFIQIRSILMVLYNYTLDNGQVNHLQKEVNICP